MSETLWKTNYVGSIVEDRYIWKLVEDKIIMSESIVEDKIYRKALWKKNIEACGRQISGRIAEDKYI